MRYLHTQLRLRHLQSLIFKQEFKLLLLISKSRNYRIESQMHEGLYFCIALPIQSPDKSPKLGLSQWSCALCISKVIWFFVIVCEPISYARIINMCGRKVLRNMRKSHIIIFLNVLSNVSRNSVILASNHLANASTIPSPGFACQIYKVRWTDLFPRFQSGPTRSSDIHNMTLHERTTQ